MNLFISFIQQSVMSVLIRIPHIMFPRRIFHSVVIHSGVHYILHSVMH